MPEAWRWTGIVTRTCDPSATSRPWKPITSYCENPMPKASSDRTDSLLSVASAIDTAAWPAAMMRTLSACKVSLPPPSTPWAAIVPSCLSAASKPAARVTSPPLPPRVLPLASTAPPPDTSKALPAASVTPWVLRSDTLPPWR
ncbi:hypothetical protein D3C87_1527660 [compost metagenome]